MTEGKTHDYNILPGDEEGDIWSSRRETHGHIHLKAWTWKALPPSLAISILLNALLFTFILYQNLHHSLLNKTHHKMSKGQDVSSYGMWPLTKSYVTHLTRDTKLAWPMIRRTGWITIMTIGAPTRRSPTNSGTPSTRTSWSSRWTNPISSLTGFRHQTRSPGINPRACITSRVYIYCIVWSVAIFSLVIRALFADWWGHLPEKHSESYYRPSPNQYDDSH